MEYREATPADADGIAELHAASWQRTYRGILRDEYLDHEALTDRLAVWRERLAPVGVQPVGVADPLGNSLSANQYVVLAAEGNEVCGFVCVYGDAHPQHGSLVDNLHVRHKYKGTGIGRRLMREAAAWVRDRYPDLGAYLWVMERNVEAQEFYRRLGGVFAELQASDSPGGGTHAAIRVVWPDLAPLLT